MDHLMAVQESLLGDNEQKYCPIRVPDRLAKYSDLPFFKRPEDMQKKQEMVGPYICHLEIQI